MDGERGRGGSAPRSLLSAGACFGMHAPAVAASVTTLRRALVAFAAGHQATVDAQDAIALAVSEAITNAVVHAYVDTTPGTIAVDAVVRRGRLDVSIADDGRGMRPRTDSPGLGLGLPTIARLATSVVIAPGRGGRGTMVRLEFSLFV